MTPLQVIVQVSDGETFLTIREGTNTVPHPLRVPLAGLPVTDEIIFLQLCRAARPGAGPDPVSTLDDGLQVPVPARRIIEAAPGLRTSLVRET